MSDTDTTPTELPIVDPETFSLTEEQARIRDLTQEVTQLRADIDTIIDHMREAADDHGFCETYDDVVDQLNSKLKVVSIPPRCERYVVTLTVTAPRGTDWERIVSVGFDRTLASFFDYPNEHQFDTHHVDWDTE